MWRRNDQFRYLPLEDAPRPGPLTPDCETNLERLADLLDDSVDGERLMKADVFRELGRFDEVWEILEPLTASGYGWEVTQIAGQSKDRNPHVVELVPRPW